MPSDIQWSFPEYPIAGVNEATDERVLPPGQFVTVKNGDWTPKDGSFTKRPGLRLLCFSLDPDNGPIDATRLVPHDDQLLVVDLRDQGTPSVSNTAGPGLFMPNLKDGSRYTRVGDAITPTVEKEPITTDLENDVYCDMAVCYNGDKHYHVYGLLLKQTGEFVIKIVERESGSVLYETHLTDTDTPVFVRTAAGLRLSDNNPAYAAVTYQTSNGKIKGYKVDLTGTFPVVSSRVDIATDVLVTSSPRFDLTTSVVGANNPQWYVVYPKAGAPVTLKIRSLANDLATVWFANWGGDLGTIRAPSVLEHKGNVFVNWYDGGDGTPGLVKGWYYRAYSATGTIVLAPTLWCGGGEGVMTALGHTSAIAPVMDTGISSADDVVLFHSQHHLASGDSLGGKVAPKGMWDAYYTRWARATTAGTVGTVAKKRGIKLWSKPWRDVVNQCYYAWCGMRTWPGNFAPTVADGEMVPTHYEWTGALMRFAEAELAATVGFKAHLASSTSGFTLGNPYGQDSPQGLGSGPYYLALDPTKYFEEPASVSWVWRDPSSLAASFSDRHCALNQRYVAGEAKSGPWDVNVRLDHVGRYSYAHFGEGTYCAGGLLTVWDGQRSHEAGFIAQPTFIATTDDSGGSWPDGTGGLPDWGGQTCNYQIVYETVMESGERERSAGSNLVTVPIAADHKTIVTLWIDPHTITARKSGANQTEIAPRTLAVIYRSSEPNEQILHRVFEFDLATWDNLATDPDDLVPLQITDDGVTIAGGNISYSTEAGLGTHEAIYNDSGELDNDLPYGGCTSLTTHKDRLWLCGGDDPEVVWYSKERADGRPAEFSIGQVIRVPGQRVTAVKGLDDNLILLCRHGIYRVEGSGPNATGDPSSGFFSNPIPVNLSVGCSEPRSVEAIPDGIIFASERGLMLLDRGLSVHFIGKALHDTVTANEHVHFARLVPRWQQIRISLSPRTTIKDGYPVAVYDWDCGLWGYWTYFQNLDQLDGPNQGQIAQDMAVWKGAQTAQSEYDLPVVLFSGGSSLYVEDGLTNADGVTDVSNGTRVKIYMESGWLSFGRLQGFKKLRKFGFLSTVEGNYGLRIRSYYNYNTALVEDRHWNSYEITTVAGQDSPGWLRMTCQYQKQPSIKLIIEEIESSYVLTSTNTADLVDTVGQNVIRLKTLASDGFTAFTVTSNGFLPKQTLVDDLNSAFQNAGFEAKAYLNSSNQVVIVSDKLANNYLAVDSDVNGSTLNRVVGYNTLGQVGTQASPDGKSFSPQSLAFEVGQMAGIRRLPALQSR